VVTASRLRYWCLPAWTGGRGQAGKSRPLCTKWASEPVGPAIGLSAAFVDSATANEWVGSFAPRSIAHQEIAALAAVVDRITRRKNDGA